MSRWAEMQKAESVPEEPEVRPEAPGMEAVEKDMDEGYDEALMAFKERREKEAKRFREITDTNHYMVLCFTTNTQLVEFCNTFGIDVKYRYYDGREVARRLNKALKSPDVAMPREKGRTKEYTELAMEPYD